MSIERFYGSAGPSFTPTCDSCYEQLPCEMSFQDAVNAKRRAGWKSRNTDGEWEDICPECQEEERRAGQ